jgi:hypothetical protein
LDTPGGHSPQNLYELTSLAYDSRRDQMILHGGGAKRDELWSFDFRTKQWRDMQPSGSAPKCSREAVYLPKQDAFLTYGDAGAWIWRPAENAWEAVDIPFDHAPARVGQNRAMVYDARRDIVLLVLGQGGDDGVAQVYALRLVRPGKA